MTAPVHFAFDTGPLGEGATGAPRPGDVQAALLDLLQTVIRMSGGEGGLMLLEAAGGGPDWTRTITHNLSPAWQAQIETPDSRLRRLVSSGGDGPAGWRDAELGIGAAVPVILADGRRAGIILLTGSAPVEAPWLDDLGHVAGRLLQVQTSYAVSRGRGRELAALNKIAATLTSTLQLDEILTSTIDGIREILNVEAVSLLLLDEERGELIFKKTLGEDPDWIFQYSLRAERGLVSECVRGGRPLLVNTVADDPRFYPEVDGVAGFKTRSVLCAPLATRGQTLGAVEVINKRDGPFDLHDQDLLVSMTASVANAIYHSRLFHQLTVANADLEASRWEVVRSRNTLRALFDGIPHAIYIVDRDYRLVALNRASAQLAGADLPAPPPAELLLAAGQPQTNRADAAPGEKNPFGAFVGQVCYQALFRRAEPCVGCRVAETLFAGQRTQRAERRWGQDDQVAEWDVSTYPILDEHGQVAQAVVFVQDVTEKRRLEVSLAQSEKLAAVGQLAAGVAHEINNPLAAIIANTQLLKRELPAEDERQESVQLIALASDRALQVVRNLLDFARQERYEFAPTDVNVSIRNAFALAAPLLRDPALKLVTDLAPDLPPVSASLDHLQGVWLNFLLNARDALAGQEGEIQVISRRQGNEVHVLVADTGAGIQPERLPRLFEPFYTTKKSGQGTGLGLFTCHRIIKQHGGHIRVDSQLGRGTVFTVVLPLPAGAPV